CVLFGDGAGAVVLQATKGDHGILGSLMKSNGNYHDFICMPGGGSDRPANDPKSIEERLPFIKMKGNETFKVAVKAMADVSQNLLSEQGITHEQVDLFIPHQANLRIIDAVGERLKIDPQKVYKNVDRYGNTSAASIPIALEECVRDGRVKTGDMVLMTTFGAGLGWGSELLRWCPRTDSSPDGQARAAFSRPGIAVRRDGQGALRVLASGASGVRRGRRRPRVSAVEAVLRRTGGRAQTHREHAAGDPDALGRRLARSRGAIS